MTKILFLTPFPSRLHSSTRFRVELYEKVLGLNNFLFDKEFFWSADMYAILYEKGNFLLKLRSLVTGIFKRFFLLAGIRKYDYIFILREAIPVGPPIFEWVCCKVLNKKIIYDFDDAIWISQASKNNSIAKTLKAAWKVKWICKWAYKVSVGNSYLYNYAAQYSKNVILNPTCVDTENIHTAVKQQENNNNKLVIGWTGSFSTLIYLNTILEVLRGLENKYEFDFLVIADRNPHLPLKNFRFKKWKEVSEIEDLQECDIGVMPLDDTEYAKGKCGFKIIQYMALGIPVAASPVGVNKQIVDQKSNGFLCETKEEWMEALEKLMLSSQLRQQMGTNGRKKIQQFYSLESNKINFLSLFT